MAKRLENKKIAVLVTKGFEQIEYEEPVKAIHNEGGETVIVSSKDGTIRAWDDGEWGETYDVDLSVHEAKVDDYDGLLIPGGVMSPDYLRQDAEAVRFVRSFFENEKPVASICHGPWMLAEADVIHGKRLTSYPSLKTDLKNAGANWVDEEVVTDQGLVTSRTPDDLEAFCRKMVEEFCEGRHEKQRAGIGESPAPM